MAMQKQNGLAYDLSLFETDPVETKSAKKNNHTQKAENNKVIRLDTGSAKREQKRRRNPVAIVSVSLLMLVLASVLSLIVYNNVMLNEYNEQILEANKALANQENLSSQYHQKIESALTDEKVRNYAVQKLGMVPANASQKKFLSMTDGDKGEVLRGDEKESFFSRLAKAFHLG